MKHFKILCFLLCLSFFVSGCGNGQVPLRGRVTYLDNGEPLEQGVVALVSPTLQARGLIQKDVCHPAPIGFTSPKSIDMFPIPGEEPRCGFR